MYLNWKTGSLDILLYKKQSKTRFKCVVLDNVRLKTLVRLECIYLCDALGKEVLLYFTAMEYKNIECIFLYDVYKHVHYEVLNISLANVPF